MSDMTVSEALCVVWITVIVTHLSPHIANIAAGGCMGWLLCSTVPEHVSRATRTLVAAIGICLCQTQRVVARIVSQHVGQGGARATTPPTPERPTERLHYMQDEPDVGFQDEGSASRLAGSKIE